MLLGLTGKDQGWEWAAFWGVSAPHHQGPSFLSVQGQAGQGLEQSGQVEGVSAHGKEWSWVFEVLSSASPSGTVILYLHPCVGNFAPGLSSLQLWEQKYLCSHHTTPGWVFSPISDS